MWQAQNNNERNCQYTEAWTTESSLCLVYSYPRIYISHILCSNQKYLPKTPEKVVENKRLHWTYFLALKLRPMNKCAMFSCVADLKTCLVGQAGVTSLLLKCGEKAKTPNYLNLIAHNLWLKYTLDQIQQIITCFMTVVIFWRKSFVCTCEDSLGSARAPRTAVVKRFARGAIGDMITPAAMGWFISACRRMTPTQMSTHLACLHLHLLLSVSNPCCQPVAANLKGSGSCRVMTTSAHLNVTYPCSVLRCFVLVLFWTSIFCRVSKGTQHPALRRHPVGGLYEPDPWWVQRNVFRSRLSRAVGANEHPAQCVSLSCHESLKPSPWIMKDICSFPVSVADISL